MVEMTVQAAADGACDFGNKSHKVRLIDGTSNMSFADPVKVVKAGAGMPVHLVGDTVLIDTDDGTFTKSVKIYYGQPANIDGKWYQVSVSADGAKVTAAAADVTTGTVKIDHPSWTATFVGSKYHQTVSGDANPVTLPADTYTITNYT